ncbi:MAG: hypothetical protein WCD18_06445 [Thermosynechococcaceae cyanobacterium]
MHLSSAGAIAQMDEFSPRMSIQRRPVYGLNLTVRCCNRLAAAQFASDGNASFKVLMLSYDQ